MMLSSEAALAARPPHTPSAREGSAAGRVGQGRPLGPDSRVEAPTPPGESNVIPRAGAPLTF